MKNMSLVAISVIVLGAYSYGCSFDARATDPRQVPIGSAAAIGTPAAGAPLVPGPGAPVVPGGPVNPLSCQVDTRVVVENAGHFIEILTSRGRLFEYDNGVPVQTTIGAPAISFTGMPTTGIELTSVPLYAQGPCLGAGPTQCVFDTHAFVRLPEGRLLEYVTAAGRQWVYENNQMTGAGVPLAAIPRYRPVCAAAAAYGAPCIFDTRVFVKQGPEVVESITAYGRSFELDINGNVLPNAGIDLMQSPRYAAGPCQGMAPGGCILETRAFEPMNGQLVETITSRGFFYTYNAETGAPLQPPLPMTQRPHWATGPCL